MSRLYRESLQRRLDDDLTTDMYIFGRNILREAGFIQYEVSSFYRRQGSSLHNLMIWNGHDYIGKDVSAPFV